MISWKQWKEYEAYISFARGMGRWYPTYKQYVAMKG